MQQAIDYEVQWQIDTIENGGKIQQATILFSPDTGETRMMRSKEDAHDYRYFPDPDLAPLRISAEWVAELKSSVRELPWQRQERYLARGVSTRNAEALTQHRESSDLFDAAVAEGAEPVRLANLLVGKAASLANQRGCTVGELGLDPHRLAALTGLLEAGKITATSAARLLELMLSDDRTVDEIARAQGLFLQTDPDAVRRWAEEALAANPQAREDVVSGGKKQSKALSYLVGQVMQRSRGTAPPQEVRRLLRELLGLR